MFKFTTRGTPQLINKLKSIALVQQRKTVQDDIGKFTVDRIQKFSHSGKSIAADVAKTFKGLSRSYKAARGGKVSFFTDNQKRLRAVPGDYWISNIDTGDFFAPNRSNITLTGQLLDALIYKIFSSTNTIAITFKGRRKKLHGQKKRLSHSRVAQYLEEGGRPFIGLDRKGKERVKNIIMRAIRQLAR